MQRVRLTAYAIVLLVALTLSSRVYALHEVAICNKGDVKVSLALLDNYGSYGDQQARVVGLFGIDSGECSQLFRVATNLTFAFIRKYEDGTFTNPVYTPSSAEKGGAANEKYICVKYRENFDVSGPKHSILSQYATATCLAGFTAIRTSFSAHSSVNRNVRTWLTVQPSRREREGLPLSPVSSGRDTIDQAAGYTAVKRVPGPVRQPNVDARFKSGPATGSEIPIFDVPPGVVPKISYDPADTNSYFFNMLRAPGTYASGDLQTIGFVTPQIFTDDKIPELRELPNELPASVRILMCWYGGQWRYFWLSEGAVPPASIQQGVSKWILGVRSSCPAREP